MPTPTATLHAVGITIACTDAEKSDWFYREVLGARLEQHDGYGCRWYTIGSLAFNLMPNAAEHSPASLPRHAMPIFWFETDDLSAARERVIQNGIHIVDGNDQSLMVKDPDGLVIEIWQRIPHAK